MKQLALIVVFALVLFALATTALQALDATIPGVVQAREREATARAQLVERQAAITAREQDSRERFVTVAVAIAVLGAGVGLAEALIDYAVRWLSHALPEQSIAGVGPVSNDLDRATAALRELRHA